MILYVLYKYIMHCILKIYCAMNLNDAVDDSFGFWWFMIFGTNDINKYSHLTNLFFWNRVCRHSVPTLQSYMKCLRGRGATFLFLRILYSIWYLITSWHEAQFVINKQLMRLETLLYTYLFRPKTKIDCQIKIPLFKIKISYDWIFNLGLPRDLKWTISSLLICKCC